MEITRNSFEEFHFVFRLIIIICNKIGYFVINFSIFFLLLFILSIYNKSYQTRTKSLSTNAHKEISTKQNVRPIGFRAPNR